MTTSIYPYLMISSILFSLGVYAVVTRKNAVAILMGIELMLNSANLNFVTFNHFNNSLKLDGHIFSIFVIVLAAAEAAGDDDSDDSTDGDETEEESEESAEEDSEPVVEEDSPSEDTPDYSSMKVAELKELLKAAGKPVSGKKDELIARLQE